MDKYISIGNTKKTFGTKGELKMNIEDRYLEDFMNAKVVFLKIGGKKVPFFLENIRVANALVVKFEEVDTPESAIPITSKEVFLREKDLIPIEEKFFEVSNESLVFAPYEGFMIEDEVLGSIGKIEEIQEFPQQEMALVKYKKKEVLIPMHEDLIIRVEESEKKLIMKLPEGILDL